MPAQDVQVLKHSDIICKKKYEKIPIIGTSRLFCSHVNLRETVRCTWLLKIKLRDLQNLTIVLRVSLTALWAATTRHCHTQQTVETRVLTCTMYLPWEEGGVGREKSSKTTVQQRKTRGMTWHPTLSSKLHSAPALKSSATPHTNPVRYCWPAILFCV